MFIFKKGSNLKILKSELKKCLVLSKVWRTRPQQKQDVKNPAEQNKTKKFKKAR
jgi:hypothetical protein